MLGRSVSGHKVPRGIILDFLAPSVLSPPRRYASSKRLVRTEPSGPDSRLAAFPLPVHSNDPAQVTKAIKERLSFLNRPDVTSTPTADINFFNESVVKIRVALTSGRDIRKVATYWSELRCKKLLRLLGRQIRDFSKLAAKLCPDLRPGQAWDEGERAIIEEIAIDAATYGAFEALKSSLLTHVRAQNPQAAHDLYRRFLGAKRIADSSLLVKTPSNETREQSTDLVLNLVPSSTSSPDQGSILLVVTAAHAQTNSFLEALRIFLQSPAHLTDFWISEVTSSLRNAELAKRVRDYAKRLNTARMLVEPRLMTAKISTAIDNQDLKLLQQLYRSTLDGLEGEQSCFAAKEADVSSIRPVMVQDIHWAAFLKAFIMCGRKDLAESLWDDMLRFSVSPGIVAWTALLDGYDASGDRNAAVTAWESMLAQGIKPSIPAYRAIISVLFNARQPNAAMDTVKAFEGEFPVTPATDHSPILAIYNGVFHGLLTNGRNEDAHALINRLRTNAPKPDIVTYNTFLRHYGRKGDMRMVLAIYKLLEEDKLSGDVFTFSTILSALMRVGRTDAVDLVMNIMKKQNVEPNVAIFSSIIDQQMRDPSEEGLKAALDLLQRMENNPNAQPNDVTYTSILAGLLRRDTTDMKLTEQSMAYIRGRMKERNIQPNRVTYHILLQASFDNPSPRGLQNALGYYREMVSRKIPMNYDTWYVLLKGLLDREDWIAADEVVDDLTKSIMPRGALLSIVESIKDRRVHRSFSSHRSR
ncbi:hypothetical protein CONPUDRAFT_115555 [Coniophora puteana RWD-64-598 SS2]|uniref:Pentacotripeptide-repeat region of PRORP domain-containing protein n=1 Tax=Coniophora puteana (strain RWD-64-598) TaxID=741705 RepID=A0A5M3N688_CONPW|nr:uncharacterized protein CONPUDRAFT_115555 [Coniophora puteana RWD-64-598 SS2]EIW86826.1 hypothetical protein CONPUDRAFT_115555 [Coniophora puteana RWD-64-598 SS2]